MKKVSLFFTSLFVAAIINAQAPSAASDQVGQSVQKADIATTLQFNEENHDFGKIPYGKPVEYDVVVKNISSDSVRIENVKVGCGCTTPKYEQGKAYGPGETFKVTLGFSGYAEGPFEKYADVVFSNGLSKQIRFHGVGYKTPEASAPASSAVQKLKNAK